MHESVRPYAPAHGQAGQTHAHEFAALCALPVHDPVQRVHPPPLKFISCRIIYPVKLFFSLCIIYPETAQKRKPLQR
jgi:hypothetical protein